MNTPAFAFLDDLQDAAFTGAGPRKTMLGDTDFGFANACYHAAHGLGLGYLLVPIADPRGDAPVSSEDLCGNQLYRRSEEAQHTDNPNLPFDIWEHELKRADYLTQISQGKEKIVTKQPQRPHLHSFSNIPVYKSSVSTQTQRKTREQR